MLPSQKAEIGPARTGQGMRLGRGRPAAGLLAGFWAGFLGGLVWALTAVAQAGPPSPLGKDEVRCSGEECSLGGCLSQALLQAPEQALHPLRALPVMAGGAAVGFQLLGVRAGGLASRIGLQNGDVLTTLNQRSLATPEAALQALTAAKDEPVIRIGLERAGKKIERRLLLDRRPAAVKRCPALPASQRPNARAAAPAQSADRDDLARDIVCQGTRCICKNGVVQRVLADPEPLLRGARVVPMFADGKQAGYKLFAIRPGSLYAAAGLQNGDVIEKIAGVALTSAESALAAYSKAKESKLIPVELRRRGAAMTLTFEVQR